MLGRFELIVALGLSFIILIIDRIVYHIRGKILPSGSIVLDTPIAESANITPGKRWTHIGATIVFIVPIILTYFIMTANIFDFWRVLPQVLFIHLPVWLNWTGMVFGLITDILGIIIRYYNVNYTLAFNKLKGRYVLATGGPYKKVRHPMYISICGLSIALFLLTELWLFLLTILLWGVLRRQAIYEEQLLRSLFKEKYEPYFLTTGRFFPKTSPKSKN